MKLLSAAIQPPRPMPYPARMGSRACSWLCLLLALAWTIGAAAADYRVTELSGSVSPRAPGGLPSIHWMDNERVIFMGVDPQITELREGDGLRVPKPALYIWNHRTNALTRYADLSDASSFCYADGYIRYNFRRDGKSVLRKGFIGKEEELVFEGPFPSEPNIAVNALTCKEYDRRELPSFGVGTAYPLKEGHGYLGAKGKDAAGNPVLMYFASGRHMGIPIPVRKSWSPTYSEYFKSYVFQSMDSQTKLWTLKLDGSVQEVDVPSGLWTSGTVKYGLTREGVFMMSHSAATETRRVFRDENRGGFLVNGGKVERIATGYISGFAVSPDGCKVAMGIGLVEGRAVVQVIDVCKQGG